MGQPNRNNSSGELKYVEPKTEHLAGDIKVYPYRVEVDSESVLPYNNEVKVSLTSLLDARLVYTGQVTGQQYVWNKAGSIVEVDAEDSKILLAKRIYGSCCGNSIDGQPIFQITT